MQTGNAHLPRERSFNGKAIDIKGCISAEGRHMWENLRQRPVDLLLPTRTPHFFPRTQAGIPIKERVLSEIESDCSGKDLWRRLRDTEESYWRRVWIIGCWNKIVRFVREKKRVVVVRASIIKYWFDLEIFLLIKLKVRLFLRESSLLFYVSTFRIMMNVYLLLIYEIIEKIKLFLLK